jgi:hypothetical protein
VYVCVCVCVCFVWFGRRSSFLAFVDERSCEVFFVVAFLGGIVVVRATLGLVAWIGRYGL